MYVNEYIVYTVYTMYIDQSCYSNLSKQMHYPYSRDWKVGPSHMGHDGNQQPIF